MLGREYHWKYMDLPLILMYLITYFWNKEINLAEYERTLCFFVNNVNCIPISKSRAICFGFKALGKS